jgi:hypothetical protein
MRKTRHYLMAVPICRKPTAHKSQRFKVVAAVELIKFWIMVAKVNILNVPIEQLNLKKIHQSYIYSKLFRCLF